MPTAHESRAALQLVTGAAVNSGVALFGQLSGSPELRRAAMLEAVPEIIAYYSDGSSALAADFYDDARERAAAAGTFSAEPVVLDRTVKIRRSIAWAALPMFEQLDVTPQKRLAEVIQFEVARPYRDTITTNRQHDEQAVGWRRVTAGGCNFCRMLADKGAIFRESTVRFAAHNHCHCGAEPVFRSNDTGETVSVMQYTASKRHRSPEERAALRDYLDTYY